MIVETGGRATGTIGGGPVEKRAMAAGQEMLFAGSEAAFMEFSLDDPNEVSSNALEIDSIYGGSMSVFIQCFHPPASLLIKSDSNWVCASSFPSNCLMARKLPDFLTSGAVERHSPAMYSWDGD